MTKLTEGMILARCRGAELETIRKLNCWGSELTDISIVKRLPCLEVLSLSVNSLRTLADLQNSKMLQELYIRKNEIADLSEICYLKELRKLKCLWLADNPCATNDSYRLTVLKHLPQLQKLDNVDVEPEELREAQDRGLDLIHPLERHSGGGYQSYAPPQVYQQANTPPPVTIKESIPASASANKLGGTLVEQPIAEDKELVLPSDTVVRRLHVSESKDSLSSEKYESPAPSIESYEYEEVVQPRRPIPASAPPSRKPSQCEAGGGDGLYGVRRHSQIEQPSYESPRSVTYGVRRPSVVEEPPRQLEEYSAPYQADFSPEYNELQMRQQQQQRQQQHMEEMRRQEELRRQAEAYHQQAVEQIEPFRSVNTSPTRSYNPRQKHRTSNILSAVLCLIKELDVRSLEVVEMSARGRIEELLED